MFVYTWMLGDLNFLQGAVGETGEWKYVIVVFARRPCLEVS
jgi:hypothetical protein